jgi:hypothetical protein
MKSPKAKIYARKIATKNNPQITETIYETAVERAYASVFLEEKKEEQAKCEREQIEARKKMKERLEYVLATNIERLEKEKE